MKPRRQRTSSLPSEIYVVAIAEEINSLEQGQRSQLVAPHDDIDEESSSKIKVRHLQSIL